MVRRTACIDAIHNALQLLLDVLWRCSFAPCSRSCFHQGQCCDANFPCHRLDITLNLCYNLLRNEIEESTWQQIVSWSYVHQFLIIKDFHFRCWIEESHYMWILIIPVLILLICSTIFLVNIVRVLITKLHPKSTNPAPIAIKKAVRATLILVRLLKL